MMSGVPLETCWAFKKLWNNEFYYEAASCWYFYWVIYDARIHEYQTDFVSSFHRMFIQSSNITILDPVGSFSASEISHVWHCDCFAKQHLGEIIYMHVVEVCHAVWACMSSWFVTICVYYIPTVTVTQHSENIQYGVGSCASRKPLTALVTECQYMSWNNWIFNISICCQQARISWEVSSGSWNLTTSLQFMNLITLIGIYVHWSFLIWYTGSIWVCCNIYFFIISFHCL